MKSSSRIISAEKAAGIQGWNPGTFGSKPEPQAPHLDEILAVFQPAAKNSQSTGSVQPWTPTEFDWVPPFERKETGFQTFEFVHGHATGSSSSSGQEKGHSSEEEALTILATARSRAEEMILDAQRMADDTLDQAEDEIRQAREKGYQAGMKKAEDEMAQAIQAAQQMIAEIAVWREGVVAQSEASIVNMIREIAHLMFGEGVTLNEPALEANLTRVLEGARSLGDLRIFLNPADAARLDPAWRKNQSLLTGQRVQVVPSENIKPGGVYVQGQNGNLDARVETQMETVLNIFDEQPNDAEVDA